jgi:hypothetical protein
MAQCPQGRQIVIAKFVFQGLAAAKLVDSPLAKLAQKLGIPLIKGIATSIRIGGGLPLKISGHEIKAKISPRK